jgi:hypothetical protein
MELSAFIEAFLVHRIISSTGNVSVSTSSLSIRASVGLYLRVSLQLTHNAE